MVLLQIPSAIWCDVLMNWLGGLREIVRLDCALCLTTTINPFFTIYTTKAFPIPDEQFTERTDVLVGLRWWMQTRKVYISHVMLKQNRQKWGHQHQWEHLITFSQETIHSLGIVQQAWDLEDFVKLTRCVKRLRHLEVKSGDNNICVLEVLLNNNSMTLESLGLTVTPGWNWYSQSKWFPCLKMLSWTGPQINNLSAFLEGCPRLLSLCVSNTVCDSAAALANAIARWCPQLRKLRICNVCELDGASLLQIARGCPQLEYLGVVEHYTPGPAPRIADVVSALPCLHTLVFDENVAESDLILIARRGHPSLRVVDTHTYFTYDGLRQITAGLPQLTGLTIFDMGFVHLLQRRDVLEYCRGLKHLIVGKYAMPVDIMDALLISVSTHCSGLHMLSLGNSSAYNSGVISTVLPHLRQLRRLNVQHDFKFALPPERRNVELSRGYPELVEWSHEG